MLNLTKEKLEEDDEDSDDKDSDDETDDDPDKDKDKDEDEEDQEDKKNLKALRLAFRTQELTVQEAVKGEKPESEWETEIITFSYDANGNMTRMVEEEKDDDDHKTEREIKEYSYDYDNRLIKTQEEWDEYSEYLYDGDGNLITQLTFDGFDDDHSKGDTKEEKEDKEDKNKSEKEDKEESDREEKTKDGDRETKSGNSSPRTMQNRNTTVLLSAYGGEEDDDDEDEDEDDYDDDKKVKKSPNIGSSPREKMLEKRNHRFHYKYLDKQGKDVFDVTNYLNDISDPLTQILGTYDQHGEEEDMYTYGLERIAQFEEDDDDDDHKPRTSSVLLSKDDDEKGKDKEGDKAEDREKEKEDKEDDSNKEKDDDEEELDHEFEGPEEDPLYYLYDGLGSVAALTDPLGNIRGEQDYDEFGNPREVPDYEHKRLGYDWDDEDSRFTYTGELWDDEEEILYLRARHYMPQIGRFLTRDSYDGDLTNPLTRHKYAYVANNPINNLDPSGNIIETASDAVSLGISIGEFAWEPNFWTGLAVIYDTAALLTPVVPAGGGYFIAAVKHGNNMEKYLQVAKEILARGNKILDKIKAHTPWWAESVPRKIKGYINDLRKRFDKFTGKKSDNNTRGPSNKNSDNKNTNKDKNSKGMSKLHKHHIYPQQFKSWFKGRGIDIDKFTIELEQSVHLKGVHGKGLGELQGRWNQRWAEWIKGHPNATKKEVEQFSQKLLKEYVLNTVPVKPSNEVVV